MIVNIVNDQIAAESVNIDSTVELGTQPMKKYESKWPKCHSKNLVELEIPKCLTETNLIYIRVIG